MEHLSATVKLRPTRIGFLVHPNDIKSIKQIMRLNTCLWGGRLNPIIPVYQRPPKAWSTKNWENIRGYNVGRGYVRFFEPDVFVEAKEGLYEKLSLVRPQYSTNSIVVSLNDFITNYRGQEDAHYGLGIFDVLKQKHNSERKFELRHKAKAVLPKPIRGSGAIEAIYGCFPSEEELDYNIRAYEDVLLPQRNMNNLALWKSVFLEGSITPLKFTLEHIDIFRAWHDDLTVFIFDPKSSADLLDLWNMRIESSAILPVPFDLFDKLRSELKNIIESAFRPVRDNNNGVMHRATIEVSRSVALGKTSEQLVKLFELKEFKNYGLKLWRNGVWKPKNHNGGPNFSRLEYDCGDKTIKVSPDDKGHAEFETLSPKFAKKYSGRTARWANIVTIGSFSRTQWATLLPLNTFDRTWPKIPFGSDSVSISSEGWVFTQEYMRDTRFVTLLSSQNAIIEWLSRNGIKAKLSDPGQNAKQIIEAADGLRGLYILQYPETLHLLNKMAGGRRVRNNESTTVTENFRNRTISVKNFEKHISTIANKNRLPKISAKSFIETGILKIGLETKCTQCHASNWRGLDRIDYEITCERCLKNYSFPQSDLKRDNGNWHHRVIGPFSIPDYAQGAYSAVLAIKAISSLRDRHENATYTTSLDLIIDDKSFEIDFALWLPPSSSYQSDKNPRFIFGESKSFAKEALKKKDISQLKVIAARLPNAAILVSVLKDDFSENEQELLRKFVLWNRKSGAKTRNRRPIILMTGIEMFADFSIGHEWRSRGGIYEKHSDYDTINDLEKFAEATQEIYLGIQPYYDWLSEYQADKG